MKKRILALLLVLAMLLPVLPTVSAEEDFRLTYKKGVDGFDREYVSITGFTGTMPKDLVIPAQIEGIPVEEIGHMAFQYGTFESVQLPKGLKRIRDYAFENGHLKTITLPEGLEYIGSAAFENNRAGGVLILPASLLSVYSAFCGNNFSAVIVLSKSTEFHYYPFDGDYSIYAHASVFENNICFSLFESNSTIAFEELPFDITTQPTETEGSICYAIADGKAYIVSCDATGELTVPDTLGGCPVVELLPGAFSSAKELTKLELPDSVEIIGSWCFKGCSKLEKLVCPKNLKEIGRKVFGSDFPENLTLYGCSDSPLVRYCVDNMISCVDLETGEPFPLPYEKEVDGLCYRINLVSKTAAVTGSFGDKAGDYLVIPETVDGCSVTRLDDNALPDFHCKGLILPDTLTYIGRHAIFLGDSSVTPFICMPNNEVYLDPSYKNDIVSYFFLPENFTLEESCRASASSLLNARCIGYEAHKTFVDEKRLITIDGTPEERLMLTDCGVFCLDGDEYTAIYLSETDPMPSSIGGIPITRVAASCAINTSRVTLGDYVCVVEDGAFYNDPSYLEWLVVPNCIEHLPADFYPTEDYACTIYGNSGGYAEKYAKEHGITFAALDKTPFTDVSETAWYYPYVYDVYWMGLMNGTSDTTFAPNATTTRAMVAQVLFNLAGEDQNVPIVYIFDDVKRDDWYFLAVTWAALTGVSTGTSETTFSPNDPVTREQLAAFLYRFTTLLGFECKERGDLNKFADKNQISGYATDAIAWAVGVGIINGKSPTTVAPRSFASRAEIAAMLCRLLTYIENNLPE